MNSGTPPMFVNQIDAILRNLERVADLLEVELTDEDGKPLSVAR